MPISSSELLWYRSAEVSDVGTNGGRMSANIITSAVKNNIYPDVSEAERIAGSTKYRKVFIKVANDDDLDLLTPKLFVETQSPGDDIVTFFMGTQLDTQSVLTGSERQYGAGQLDANVSASASVITVLTEGGASPDQIFQAADEIRISDKTSVLDAGNNEEIHTILTAVYAGDVVTITLDGTTLANGYAASNTRVASIVEPGTVAATFDTVVNGSALGTFDSATLGNLVVDNIGGIEQDWTLTFTSATVFNITGNTLGLVGSSNVSVTTAPNNTDFTKPFFAILAATFGGTFATAETITFSTRPAALAVWHKRIVPAGAVAIGSNNFIVGVSGESS